jgi:hypothetical protein
MQMRRQHADAQRPAAVDARTSVVLGFAVPSVVRDLPPAALRDHAPREPARRGLFWIDKCDGLADEHAHGWIELLDDERTSALDAIVAVVNPCARCRPLEPSALAARGAKTAGAWSIEIDERNERLAESPLGACAAGVLYRGLPVP